MAGQPVIDERNQSKTFRDNLEAACTLASHSPYQQCHFTPVFQGQDEIGLEPAQCVPMFGGYSSRDAQAGCRHSGTHNNKVPWRWPRVLSSVAEGFKLVRLLKGAGNMPGSSFETQKQQFAGPREVP